MGKGWKISLLVLSLVLYGAKQTLAQESGSPQEEINRQQAKINELKAQMAEMQSKLDAMSGTKPPQTGAIVTTPPPAPPSPHLTPEQQLEAEGKATRQHHTFSEDEDAAPRLYNAPPKAPSKVFWPHHSQDHKKKPAK
jgi:hypothetical protein